MRNSEIRFGIEIEKTEPSRTELFMEFRKIRNSAISRNSDIFRNFNICITRLHVFHIRFKTLAVMARVFLCVPATQTKSERLNSTSGHIVEDRRSKLLTQHVTELTFLHENL